MRNLRLHPPVLLDPRPPTGPPALKLAPRLSSLAGRRLLLFDNGRLGRLEGARAIVYPTLGQRLQELYGVAACLRLRQTPSASQQGAMRQLANKMVTTGVDGVVLALCDSGSIASTIVLAWELERLGMPTLTLCRGQALYVAAAMTQPVLPGLPLSPLHANPQTAPAEIAAEVFWIAGEVGDGLTTAPADLEATFHETFAPARQHLQATGGGELAVWTPQSFALDDTQSGMCLDPSTYMTDFYEAICDSGLGDGLPVLPPTPARVEAMLAYTDRDTTAPLITHCFPSGLPLTVGTLAVNAVMAGCPPQAFPLLLTAIEAVADPRYRLAQTVVSPEPSGHAIIVSGPLAEELRLASGAGCLGPGHRTNLTLSRAFNLSLMHASGALSGRASQNAIGSPVQLAMCCAENVQASPWLARHAEQGEARTTTVTVLKCASPQAVMIRSNTAADEMLHYMGEVAAVLGQNSALAPMGLLVLLNPAHAAVISAAGWCKRDVQQYFFDRTQEARQAPARDIAGSTASAFADVPDVSDVMVIVTGAPGFYSMIGLPWGPSRHATRVVTARDGRPLHRLQELVR